MPSTASPAGLRRGRYPRYRDLIILLAAALSVATQPAALRAFGQDDEQARRKAPSSKDRTKMLNIAKGKPGNKEEDVFFDDYVQYYVDNLVAPETLDAKLPDKRSEIKNKLLRDLSKPPTREFHDLANRKILDACVKAIEDPKQDVRIRFNCAVMIGELDSPEAYVGGPPAAPWSAANAELLKILADGKQHLAVRLAATFGLHREMNVGLPADAQAKLADALAEVLKEPLKEQTEGQRVAQTWLRWSSAKLMESLAEKGAAVDKSVMAAALVALAADEKAPVWMRCASASGLGKIEARDLSALEIQPTVQMLAELLVTSLAASPFVKAAELSQEAEKLGDDKEGKEDKDKEGAAARVEMTEKARHMNANDLLAEIDYVRIGLAGVSAPTSRSQPRTSTTAGLYAAADDDAKKSIGQLLEHLDAAIKVLRGDGDLATISNSVVDTRDNIQTILAEGIEPSTAAAKSEPRRTGGPPAGNNPATSPVRQ